MRPHGATVPARPRRGPRGRIPTAGRSWHGLVPGSMVRAALEREKRVYRAHGGWVRRHDPDFGATGPVDRLVRDPRAPGRHDRRAGHLLGMDLERLPEGACRARPRDMPHGLADTRDGHAVPF